MSGDHLQAHVHLHENNNIGATRSRHLQEKMHSCSRILERKREKEKMEITYSGNIFFIYDEEAFAIDCHVQIVDLQYQLLFRCVQLLTIAGPKRQFLNILDNCSFLK